MGKVLSAGQLASSLLTNPASDAAASAAVAAMAATAAAATAATSRGSPAEAAGRYRDSL